MSIQDIIIKPTISDPIIELTGSSGNISQIQQISSGLMISSSLTRFTGSIYLTEDLAVNGGDITTTSTTLNVGSPSSTLQNVNMGCGLSNSNLKTINIGTSNITGGDTDIRIGTGKGLGTIYLHSPSVEISGELKTTGNVTLGNASSDIITLDGSLVANGNVTLGNSSLDLITINGSIQDFSTKGNVVLGDDVSDTTTINGKITSKNGMDVTGSVRIVNNLFVTGNVDFGGNVNLGNNPTNDTININGTTNFLSTAATVFAGPITTEESIFVDSVFEKTTSNGVSIDGVLLKDSGIKCLDVEIKSNQIYTGTLSRRIQHIPENYGDQTTTNSRLVEIGVTPYSLTPSINFTCDSEIPISKLKIGDTISFFSHVKKNIVSSSPDATVGASAQYTSSIILGTGSLNTTHIVSKITFAHDSWYEASHAVTAHVLDLTANTITLATTGTGCNVHNNEASSAPPTIIPRIITTTYNAGANLFFIQRCAISSANASGWYVRIDRKVDKTILHKFSSTL